MVNAEVPVWHLHYIPDLQKGLILSLHLGQVRYLVNLCSPGCEREQIISRYLLVVWFFSNISGYRYRNWLYKQAFVFYLMDWAKSSAGKFTFYQFSLVILSCLFVC